MLANDFKTVAVLVAKGKHRWDAFSTQHLVRGNTTLK